MSRITKEIAKEVAKQLSSKKRQESVDAEILLESTVREMYLETIPQKVKEFQLEYPKYINTRSTVQLVGNGLNYKYIHVDPVITTNNSCTCFSPTPEQAEIIINLSRRFEELRKEYEELASEIEIALLSLKTYSKIEKEFPEAFKLLPDRISTALAININSIREKLPTSTAA